MDVSCWSFLLPGDDVSHRHRFDSGWLSFLAVSRVDPALAAGQLLRLPNRAAFCVSDLSLLISSVLLPYLLMVGFSFDALGCGLLILLALETLSTGARRWASFLSRPLLVLWAASPMASTSDSSRS